MNRADSFLEEISSRRIRPDLEPIKNALLEAGFSENNFKRVLIAGTNGKGSTSFILYKILQSAGIKAGLVTSPHLCSVIERIKIEDDIDEEEWIKALRKYMPLIKRYSLTYYEITILLAFHFFREREVEVGIFEIGMGGRWDASNVFGGEYGVITSIGLDHTNILGKNRVEIFKEKVEILRKSRSGVSGVRKNFFKKIDFYPPEGIFFYGEDFLYRRGKKNSIFKIIDVDFKFPVCIPVPQWNKSISMALTTAYLILGKDSILSRKRIIEDKITSLKFEGRWDIRRVGEKLVLLDVAHNPQAWSRLIQNIEKYFSKDEKPLWIVGVMKDKNWKYLFKKLEGCEVLYVEVGPDNRRLQFEIVKKDFPKVKRCESIIKCIRESEQKKIVVTGSFYTVSEVLCSLSKS